MILEAIESQPEFSSTIRQYPRTCIDWHAF